MADGDLNLFLYLLWLAIPAAIPGLLIVGVLIWMFCSALKNILWPPKDQ